MISREMSAWKDLQLFFSTKNKNSCITAKRVQWADKLEEIRYFIKDKDMDNIDKNHSNIEEKNNRNKTNNTAKKPVKTSELTSSPNLKLTKEMVRLALCKNGGSNAEKNWKKLFKLVSSAVLDDRINDIMASDWV